MKLFRAIVGRGLNTIAAGCGIVSGFLWYFSGEIQQQLIENASNFDAEHTHKLALMAALENTNAGLLAATSAVFLALAMFVLE